MTRNSIQSLLLDMWDDVGKPDVLLQCAAVLASLGLAWAVSRYAWVRISKDQSTAVRVGLGGMNRVVFPLVAVVLLFIVRAVLSQWTRVNLLSVAIPLLGSLAGIRFVVYLLRLLFSPGRWVAVWERGIAALVWGCVALYLSGLMPDILARLDEVKFSIGRQGFSLLTLIESAFWIVSALLLAMWAGRSLESRMLRAATMHLSLRTVLARMGKAGLLLGVFLVVLPVLGIDLTLLSVFGGAVGVGLGFGLQKIASNYVSGMIILMDQSIRVGDWITADNHYGEVMQITTRFTVVRSLTGEEALIPNDILITSTVLSNTFADKRLRLNVSVAVSYSTDIAQVLDLLSEIASHNPRVLADPAPRALVVAMGDSGVELELGFWIEDPENGRKNVRSEISVAILSGFRSAGIEIPFPQREVRMLRGAAA